MGSMLLFMVSFPTSFLPNIRRVGTTWASFGRPFLLERQMKITWDPIDIDEFLGHVVQSNHGRGEKFILGYTIGCGDGRRCLISLSDGMIIGPMTSAQMVEHLNKTNTIFLYTKEQASK